MKRSKKDANMNMYPNSPETLTGLPTHFIGQIPFGDKSMKNSVFYDKRGDAEFQT